jgi:predicted dehydrogenase/threonine dehydrogenase-like Zn-dependent dehydrogenase
MKQILQNLYSGETEVVDISAPTAGKGSVLICTRRSLVSAGTERMLMEFGKSGFIGKAQQHPDKVREVIDKVRTDGFVPTIDAVRSKLEHPIPLGYCNVGDVVEVGEGVNGFCVRDRVVSNGPHAEIVSVPENLCARVPDSVSDDEAAFTILGAIALQGIRLIQPTLGETVVVTGLGVIGLIAVQLLRANGCRVLGIDFDEQKLSLAKQWGADVVNLSKGQDPVQVAMQFSRGRGVDAVLLTASTKSSEPASQAAKMCRKRGRLVLVGVTGLELSRADFYEKELSFQVSCSYGPGRYDTAYEEEGNDYPIGFVRWTEQRNFEAVLDMMSAGRLELEPLITARFEINGAQDGYKILHENKNALGILIDYPAHQHTPPITRTLELEGVRAVKRDTPAVSFVGAGNYASRILIPAFRKSGADLDMVISQSGVSGTHYGKKYGFRKASTDIGSLYQDKSSSTIVVATRHDTHAQLVCDALRAGKHVFVEKPLALKDGDLDEIHRVYDEVNRDSEGKTEGNRTGVLLMVGFNRRFAPQAVKIKSLLNSVSGPKVFIMTINAGAIPASHWTQDPKVGGGRIVGEACHFVDLLRFLAGTKILDYQVTYMKEESRNGAPADKVSFTLRFEDGSFGTVLYLSNGHRSFPKERLEVFCDQRVLQLDNFRKLTGYGWKGFRSMNLWRQDKGQNACVASFLKSVSEGLTSPIPLDELLEVSKVTLAIAQTQRRP